MNYVLVPTILHRSKSNQVIQAKRVPENLEWDLWEAFGVKRWYRASNEWKLNVCDSQTKLFKRTD